jgi:hypothetical protein
MRARTLVSLALATVLCNAAAFAQPTTQRPAGPGQRQPSAPSPTTPGGQRGQQRPPRDTADAPAGTAVISGRVTEADSGRPIRRAIVQVLGRSIGRDSRVTATDDDGAFVVRELPAGEFIVSARTPALLRTAYLLTGDWAAGEDLLQTTLEQCWRRWNRLGEHPEPYVRQAMLRTFLSWRPGTG